MKQFLRRLTGATPALTMIVLVCFAQPALSQQWVATWDYASTGQSGMAPYGVALDDAGHVYVSNLNNVVAHKFTTFGVCVDTLGWTNNSWDAPLSNPRGVAVNSQGTVFIANTGVHQLRVFNSAGLHVADWGSFGADSGEFNDPYGVAIAPGDTVYVIDAGNRRVQVFGPSGNFIRQWGSFGSGPGQFRDVVSIATDDSGFVYVGDHSGASVSRIQKFNRMGQHVRQWGSPGSGEGEFTRPMGIAADQQGRVYVTDYFNHRVQVFDSTGVYITQWGGFGTGNGEFNGPIGVAVAASGIVYVADYANSRVQKFAPITTAVGDIREQRALRLAPPSPNPSSGASILRFTLPRESSASVEIHDMQGRRVAGWTWPLLAAGAHQVSWNGRAEDGHMIPAAIFFCRLTSGGETLTQRLVRLR